jgi:acetyl esterase/lipase
VTSRGRAPSAELAESRALIEQYAAEPSAAEAVVTPASAHGVEMLRIAPPGAPPDAAFLHFHGGGYRQGSPRGFAAATARIAKAAGMQAFSVRYRLAPENPFPAALEDAVTAYTWLLGSGIPAERIVLWGDSAGGGLAAALLLRIAELQLARPAGAVLFSAWLDLRITAPSYAQNAQTDLLFSMARAAEAAADYLDGHDATDPLASPALGSWTGQPPLLVLVSDIEVLRDDSVLLAKSAAQAGVTVRLERFPDTQHIWPIMDFPGTAESVRAVSILRDFLASELRLIP